MKEETQNRLWATLSKEERDGLRKAYALPSQSEYSQGYDNARKYYFGHHNLTSDEEPEEMLTVSAKEVREYYARYKSFVSTDNIALGICQAMVYLFGKDKCLPDQSEEKPTNGAIGTTPPASKLDVKPTPRFKVGDKVRVIASIDHKGKVSVINEIIPHAFDKNTVVYGLDGIMGTFMEHCLAPYTEPEPQQTKDDMEENKSGKEVNFPTKELNLAELLRKYDADKIYLVDEGEVELVEIIDKLAVDVKGVDGRHIGLRGETLEIKPNGFAYIYPSKEAFLKYPLEAAKAWSEWKSERTPKRWRAKDGEYYYRFDAMFSCVKEMENGGSTDNTYYGHGNYFQTREECFKAAEAVKRTLEEFHAKLAEK